MTVNHPSTPLLESDPNLDITLLALFSKVSPFQFAMTEVRRFPEALYLAMEAKGRLKRLVNMVSDHFPELIPYERRFDNIIPRLTVAYLEDSEEIDEMSSPSV